MSFIRFREFLSFAANTLYFTWKFYCTKNYQYFDTGSCFSSGLAPSWKSSFLEVVSQYLELFLSQIANLQKKT